MNEIDTEGRAQELPDLTSAFLLTNQLIEDYRRDGHILIRNLATETEVQAYGMHIRKTVKDLNTHTKPLSERDTYGKAFIQVMDIWRKNEAVKRFVFAKRFAKAAAELMGVSGVRIYHDQALFKEPGGGHTPWHQDQIYWPLDTNHVITLWMPLVPIPNEVGSLTFASSSHHKGFISKLEISDQSHKTLGEYIVGEGLQQVNYGGMAAGDATFHSGWTLHSAPGNQTEEMREVMTVVYFADGARVMKPDSNARRSALEHRFPGLRPGDIINGESSPLLYC